MGEKDVPRAADLPPGYDEDDPYENESLEEYPGWWRRNIKKFREYDLRPYRPPRFADEKLVPEVVTSLEAKFGVEIRIQSINPQFGEDWEIWVDDKCVSNIGRRRTERGNSVYTMRSDEFESLISSALED